MRSSRTFYVLILLLSASGLAPAWAAPPNPYTAPAPDPMHSPRSLVEQPIWPVLAAASIQLGDQANEILSDKHPLTQGDRLKKLAKEFDEASRQWVETAYPTGWGDSLFNESLLLTEPLPLNSLNPVVRAATIDRAHAGVLIEYAEKYKGILESSNFLGFRLELHSLLFSKGIDLLDRGRFSFVRILPKYRTLAACVSLGFVSAYLVGHTGPGYEFICAHPRMYVTTVLGFYFLPALVRAARELAGDSRLRRQGVEAMEYAVDFAKNDPKFSSALYSRLLPKQGGACHRRILRKLNAVKD